MEPLYWLMLHCNFLVIELITLGLTDNLAGGGAWLAFWQRCCSAVTDTDCAVLVVSIVLIVFTRPVAERYFNNSREQTNVGGIIGREGKVIVTIDNFNKPMLF